MVDKVVYSCEFDHHESFSDTPILGKKHRRLVPKNGFFTYRINNFSPDISRHEVELIIEDALDFWEEMMGFAFVYTDLEECNLEFNFAVNSDRTAPLPFEDGVLAYAFAPWRGRSNVWINDDIDWSKNDGDYLYRVIIHELGHSLNLGHSEDRECIMYPRIHDNEVQITLPTIRTIEKLYPY